MAIGLVLISFLALIGIFWQGDSPQTGLRSAFLQAAVVHGGAIALMTEGLSAGKLLTAQAVTLEWTLLALINCGILALLHYSGRASLAPDSWLHLINRFQRQSPWDRTLMMGVIAILGICLVTALIAPPNNWDSMSYHMPRVMHWIQNRSLAHYPTHNLRQISFPGGANYIVLHFQLLAGSDRFANCVQWVAFLGCILGTSLVTRIMDHPSNQVLTAVVCASISMAIMQSTTPQTDLVVSFWLVCLAYFTLRPERYSPLALLWVAASWGLAVLTKPTALIFGIPLLVLLGFRLWHDWKPGSSLGQGCLIAAGFTAGVAILGLGLSLPSYGRNLATFGSVLGIDTDTRNAIVGPVQLISNVLRNIAVLIPFPPVFSLAHGLHLWMGLDPSDPASTFISTPFNISILNWRNLLLPDEDAVSSPIHACLTLISISVLLGTALPAKRRSPLWQLAASNLAGFLLFCLLLRWQVWHNRLLLPFLILSAPLVSQVVSHRLPQRISSGLAGFLTLVALAYSLLPIHHPLIGLPDRWTNPTQSPSILSLSREDLFFSTYIKHLREPYLRLADTLIDQDHCYALGLNISADDWEYPFWALLHTRAREPFKIRHEQVENVSQSLPPEFPPEQLCGVFEKRLLELRYYKRNLPVAPSL